MKQTDISREAAAALVAQMSIEEKLGLLTTHQHAVERLGLPEFYIGTEVARGYVGREESRYSTVFPQPVGMAATFDKNLMHRLGEIAGNECRAYYNTDRRSGLCVWGPTVDMERDPRWGRTEEAYGEDVCLAGEMTAAYTSGMAGDHPVYLRVLPTLKHFCANNTEETRASGNSYLPPRLKYEYYYGAFMPAVRYGGARSVMAAYNEVNGVPAMCNPELETLLRQQWGLWFTVTDGADFGQNVYMHRYCESHAESYAEGIAAGCDIMTDEDSLTAAAAKKALESGLLSEEALDRMLTNVIYARMRLGQLSDDCPYDAVTADCIDCEESRAVNLQAAQEQIVLLKNNGLLPLPPKQIIAVCGALAEENLMDWYTGYFRDAVTVTEGIRKAYPESEIRTDSLWDIVTIQAANGKYLSVHADGACAFDADTVTESEQFELQDWGENWQNLFSCKYRKYLRVSDDATLRLHQRRIYDWFTHETFRLLQTPEGTVFESLMHHRRMCADASGTLLFRQMPAISAENVFTVSVFSSGAARAEALASECDAVIYCTGNHPVQTAKECYDRKTLALQTQAGMAEHLCSVNPATVMMLISGYPYAINAEQEKLPAILWSSHAGAPLGTAAASVISGAYSPAGRLPMTWYRSELDLPEITDYDIETAQTTYQYFRGKPLYPFGYGLSYAAFRYEALQILTAADGALRAEVTVRNLTDTESDEVIELYYTVPDSAVSRPLKKLCGFARSHFSAGERKTVTVQIPAYTLQIYDTHSMTMMTEAGRYHFYAGSSSDNLPLEAVIPVAGHAVPLRRESFEAAMFDSADSLTIGYCRKLHRHDLRSAGWGGTAVYSGVPFAGKHTLLVSAAAITGESRIQIGIGSHSLEFRIQPSDSRDDFRRYSAKLPDGLPDSGIMTVYLGGGASLLDICLE